MKTPLTKARLRTHFAYNFWKYLLVAVIAIFGWNLIYTTTAYRPPADKKVDFYVSSATGSQTALDLYLEGVRLNEMTDMEEMSSAMLTVGSDDYYGAMQLSTYVAAGEGDIYLLDKSTFVNYATSGAFLPLEDLVDSGALDLRGIDAKSGWRKYSDEDVSETHLYGIPADSLTGLTDYGVLPDGCYLAVLVSGGNDENAVKLLNIMLRDWTQETPATPTDLATPTDAAK